MAQGKDNKTPKAGADSKVEKNTQSDVSNEQNKEQSKEKNKEKSKADQKTAKANAEIEKLEAELKAQAALSAASSKPTSSSQETKKPSSSKPDVKPSSSPGSGSSSGSSSTHNTSSRVPAKKTKKPFSWLALFAFLFSLVAVSGVAYLWWQAQQFTQTQQKDLEQTKTLAEQSYQQTRNTLQNVQDNLAQLQLNQQRGNDFVLNTQQSLQSLNNRIKELGQSQPNTWLAAESLYLVNLAEHRLLIEKDTATAVQLLLAANVRLVAMQDPSVFYIRTAISEDIAVLNSIVQPDTESSFLAISGVISQLETLPLARKYTPDPVANESKPQVSEDISDWKQNLANSVERFMGNFVTITRRDTPIEPELPPKQQWFVRANVTSQLLAAQNASLNYKQKIYQTSIDQSLTWLRQYFDLSSPAVISAITTLEAIQNKQVELQLPAGLTTQPLLKAYVAQQLNLQSITEAGNE
ncbi:uroporphyrinogen-III C-methyltransferase [Psychrosphaera haliotis]|uniref:Heme biosynthesis operon protein HemX n=1 Tax=Psychrosphaera haliotis TaxID=555083 RepID=A0A6N8FA28_9GAMM|nr:uroporphyrinogen-III C-methyltransferase [Psychrosphaera haliotis]MUH73303.1 hypothetical protein [Psychrosphaera haliotis]